jgi:cell division protein FtsQ
MNRYVKIALNAVGWAVLLACLIASARYVRRRQAVQLCTGVEIVVRDSLRTGFMTPRSIRGLLDRNGLKPTGELLREIDLPELERVIAAQPYVRKVDVFTSLDGVVRIEVEQHTPVLRVQSENGYRFYLSADGRVMPLRRTSVPADVPVVTGLPTFSFGTEFAGKIPETGEDEKISDKNAIFCRNLINFVEFLKNDPFWGDQVVQIDIVPENEVELIPRVGTGIIRLGDLEGYKEKLDKLFRFYRRGLAYEGWNKYSVIDIRFRDQVICTP